MAVLSGCGSPQDAGVERKGIITLAPNVTETVFALGEGGRVIAVSSFCDYPAAVAALPKVGGHIDPNLEKIALLSPALLIVGGKHQAVSEYAALHDVPMLNVHMDSIETIDAGIAAIGQELGCQKQADALRARIRRELDAVRAAVSNEPRPKVLIITTRQTHDLNSLYTVGQTSFVSEVVDCAGGENIYADASMPYLEASKETIVVKAPEVILEFHAGERLEPEQQAKFVGDWQQLPSLPAVKHGRVYLVLDSHALRPGPRVGEIARIVARLLHPGIELPKP